MQVALAASNLLGTTSGETREVFDNIARMYALRNQSVHGDPSTQEAWDASLLEIARTAGSFATDLRDGVREYAFEIMRDYARRTIACLLNLYYDAGRPPSTSLTSELHRLHLDPGLRTATQQAARAYPITDRPASPK